MNIKECPFCGHLPREDNLIDSFHPTTTQWYTSPAHDVVLFGTDIGFIHSSCNPLQNVLSSQITSIGTYWEIHCLETEGGCGVTMSGTSEENVLEKWNKRA